MSAFLCDVNVWLALTLSHHVHHGVASDWLGSVEHRRSILSCLSCRATQQSLLRLLTNRTVLGAYGNEPLTNDEAWEVVEARFGPAPDDLGAPTT